jgi:hypothetical protein
MRFSFLIILYFFVTLCNAQSPTDAELMSRQQTCTALLNSRESWSQYWEGSLFRSNGNIGKLKNNTYAGMIAYGVANKLNIIVSSALINKSTTQGTVAGNKGIQDLALHLKYNLGDLKMGSIELKSFLVVGGSIPATNYNEDGGPTSIGLGCSEYYGRFIADITHSSGVFLRPSFAYHNRTNATLERTYYYDSRGHYSSKIDIPNQTVLVLNFGVRLLNKTLRAETSYAIINTIGGSDLRRNEAPIANGNMDATKGGFFIKYDPNFGKGFGVILSADKILSGSNVGKSTSYTIGLNYRFGGVKA